MQFNVIPRTLIPRTQKYNIICFVCLFDLTLYVPSTIFQLKGTGLPGLNQYEARIIVSQGPQRSDAGEAQTCGPSVSSQALYH